MPIHQEASQVVPQSVAAPGAESAAKLAAAQQAKLHYVEIGPSLKGDYKFGYDTGSGPAGQSFREETRLDDGTVKGAYGYVDANGKQRIVKYTAGKAGFVVEADQEAPGQSSGQQQQPAQPEHRRPQPVVLPQHHQSANFERAPAQLSFDDAAAAAPINRAPQQHQPQQPTPEDRFKAEQLHAEQLRQHQLAQQAAIAQQQRLAQQLQLQQQQQLSAQRQAAAQQQQQQQQQQQHQQARLPGHSQQHPVAAPQHQVIDPQTGSFFSSSSDANLNQLLANQIRQFQPAVGNHFPAHHHQPQQVPQSFPQATPAFPAPAPSQFQPQSQFGAPVQSSTGQLGQELGGVSGPVFRSARQAGANHLIPQSGQPQQPIASPQAALMALHQQQQHDAQILANLRAQQLAQLQQQPRQQTATVPIAVPSPHQHQHQHHPHHQATPSPLVSHHQQSQSAPLQVNPQLIARGPTGQQAAPIQASTTAQPEVFGPPVIDIRTLNYSIGQQTRV